MGLTPRQADCLRAITAYMRANNGMARVHHAVQQEFFRRANEAAQ